jgi:hypothetical protein
MEPNFKLLHVQAYMINGSVEQQMQQNKGNVRFVDIGVLEEDFSSEWASSLPKFAFPNKNEK